MAAGKIPLRITVMNREIDLKKIRRESFVHFEQDGLNEILYGVIALLMTPFILLFYKHVVHAYILIIVLATLAAVCNKIFLYVLRKQLQAPRTGYAKLPEPSRNTQNKFTLYHFAVLMLVLIAQQLLGLSLPLEELWPAVGGLMLSGVYFYYYFRSGQLFYLLLAPLAITAGIFSIFAGNDLFQKWIYFLLITGAFSLAAGLIRLLLFLRSHPRIEPETSDDSQQA